MVDSLRLRGIELHAGLLTRDHVALEPYIADLRVVLIRKLRRSFPRFDPDDLVDAATDAILIYLAKPHRFDDTRNVPLDAFVCGIAARILRTRMRSARRRSAREDRYATHIMNISGSEVDNQGTRAVLVQQVRRALEAVCTTRERGAVMAWLAGQDSEVVAQRLGVDGLEPPCRRHEVELFIKRVTKRLQRHFRANRGGA